MLVVDSGSILVLSPPIHSGNFHRMPTVRRFKMLNNRSRFLVLKVSFLQSSIPLKFVLLTNAGCYTFAGLAYNSLSIFRHYQPIAISLIFTAKKLIFNAK